MTPTPRRLTINTLANGVSTVARLGVAFIVAPILIHTLGPEVYAVWVLATSFSIGGFFSIFELGLQQSTVKFVAEHLAADEEDAISHVFSLSAVLYGALGVLAALAVAALAGVGPERVFALEGAQVELFRQLLAMVGAFVALSFFSMPLTGLILGANRLDLLRFLEIGTNLVWLAVVLVFRLQGWSLLQIFAANLLIMVAKTAVLAVISRRLFPRLRVVARIEPTVSRAFWSYVSRFVALKVSSFVFLSVDKAIISILLAATLLTDYDVAYKLHQVALIAVALVSHAVLPSAAAAGRRDDTEALRRLLFDGTKYTVAIAIPVVSFSIVLAPEFLAHWVGAEYARVAWLCRLFLVHLYLQCLVSIGTIIMQGLGRFRRLIAAAIASAVVNLLLSLLLSQLWQLYGLAIGTLLASVTSFAILLPWFLREFGVTLGAFLRGTVVPVLPAGAVSLLLLAGLGRVRPPQSLLEVALYGGACALIYAVVFWLSGVSADERRAIVGQLRRPR